MIQMKKYGPPNGGKVPPGMIMMSGVNGAVVGLRGYAAQERLWQHLDGIPVLCRAFANTLLENKSKLDALGVKLVGIVKEWDQEEIDDFTKKFWPADLFFDESRKIFTSLTDGQETKLSLLQLANPFSAAWKAARKAKQTVTDSNFKGEGQIPGGLLVMRSGGGGIVYSHTETSFGDHPPMADVLAAAKKASN